MDTADLLMLFAVIFNFLLGLTSACPCSSSSPVARSLSPNSRVSPTPIATRDDDHLCYGLTDIAYEYGNQANQSGIISDCEELSQDFKAITDEQGNITHPCGGVPPPSKVSGEFTLLGSHSNCLLWIKCLGSDTRNEVTMDYGDIADVIKLATDGLGSSGLSENSSIVSVHASTECQTLETDWIVAFNSSEPVGKSQQGTPGLRKIANNFSPVGEFQQ